ncbi:alpha-(1,3)-fucosyltransferase C-like [Dreissena polymorpha]|nr:alpha-(1,3)-fucosyltransferase C-like [Dreissena polymorpha]
MPVVLGVPITMSIDNYTVRELLTSTTLAEGNRAGVLTLEMLEQTTGYQNAQLAIRIKTNKKYDKYFKSPYFDNFTLSIVLIQEVKHTILYWNKPVWLKDLRDKCLNCEVITDRTKARDASAIVFSGMTDDLGKPPLSPEERKPNQAWIFSSTETPRHMFQEYLSPDWQGIFNWTWTYRPTATIFVPYGIFLTKLIIPQKNYTDIFNRKSKLAMWVVSHCKTDSKREIYVEKMNKYKNGTVDIFGGCGKYKPTWEELVKIITNYKFYIAFENSICIDYFTEKFFLAFAYDIIPVVRGGADYARNVPDGTYVDTQDFESTEELVDYLIQLASDENKYTEILRRKDRYKLYAGSHLFDEGVCRICKKLNDIDRHRANVLNNSEIMGNCRSPTDEQ